MIYIKKLFDDAIIPSRVYNGDAGVDLHSLKDYCIEPGENMLISTGIAISIPHGTVGYIMSRSGLALKHQVVVLNAPGVIDSGYTGEIKVNLMNFGKSVFLIEKNMRIAQLVIQQVKMFTFKEVCEFKLTERGSNGHGSSGT